VKKALLTDAAGIPILSQLVDMDGDESPDELVFQTDLAAKETKTFKLKVGQRPVVTRDEYKVFGRFVRERHDDFAWENDRVAHRVYGPDLETCPKEPLTSSGVDTWVKRVSKLVVNDWYMTDNYHQDMGEGADFYAVGKSRGCGGIGIWAGGKLNVSKNFTHSRVLANGPIRLVFELTYAPWDVGSAHVGETKRVILDAGSQFNRFESTFTGQKGALSVGIGIAKHPGSAVKVDARGGSMRTWEPLDGGKAGNLGCAVVLPAGAHMEEHHGDLEYLVVTGVPANGKLAYYAGSGWDRAGRILDAAAWAAEVHGLAARMAAPVKIGLAVDK
jgi:unsaturated rhamnogalacturonyl hydrolase